MMRKSHLINALNQYMKTLEGTLTPPNSRMQWLAAFLSSNDIKAKADQDEIDFTQFEKFIDVTFKKKAAIEFDANYLHGKNKSAPFFRAFKANKEISAVPVILNKEIPDPEVLPTAAQVKEAEVIVIPDEVALVDVEQLPDAKLITTRLENQHQHQVQENQQNLSPSPTTLDALVPNPNLPELQKRGLLRIHGILNNPNGSEYKEKMGKLRPHQIKFMLEVCNALNKGIKHAIVEQATGAGKTVEMAVLSSLLIDKKNTAPNNKILILIPRTNLAIQTINQFHAFAPELTIAQYDAKNGEWKKADVVIATVQAAVKNNFLEQMITIAEDETAKEFYTLFQWAYFDEGQHFNGEKTIPKVVQRLKENSACLAFTATPEDCFERMGINPKQNPITPYTFAMAQKDAVVAPVVSGIVSIKLNQQDTQNLNKLAANHHDMNEQKTGRIINTIANNNAIVNLFANGCIPPLSHTRNPSRLITQKTMIFAAGVNHAEDLAKAFNRHIKVEGNPYLEGRREEYVKRTYKSRLEKYLQLTHQQLGNRFDIEKSTATFHASKVLFDEDKVRRSFKVALAIHSGQYSVSLTSEQVKAALETGRVIYPDYETGENCLFDLTLNENKKEYESLKKEYEAQKNTAYYAFKVKVRPALNPKQIDEALEQYKNGGCLVTTTVKKLIEGFDDPETTAAINAAPTTSETVAIQRFGRPGRKNPNNPGKLATIIDIDYGVDKQLFFADVMGAWQFGYKGEVPEVDHTRIPLININDEMTANNGIKWEPDNTLVLHQTRLQANHGRKRLANNAARQDNEINLDKMISEIDATLSNMNGFIEKLDKDLALAKEIVLPANSPLHVKKRSVNQSSSLSERPTVVTDSTLTRSHAMRIKAFTATCLSINERIEDWLTQIEELANIPSAKRQKRTAGSDEESESPNPRHKSASNLQALVDAVARLRSLQNKLKTIALGNKPPHETHTSSNSPEDSLLIEGLDLEDLQFQLKTLKDDLELTQNFFGSVNIVSTISALKQNAIMQPVAPVIPAQENLKSSDDHSSIPLAVDYITNGKWDLLVSLINKEPNIVTANPALAYFPLHLAAYLGKTQICSLLLSKNANPNVKDNHDIPPLFVSNLLSISALLLKYHADINHVSLISGETALDVAVRNKNFYLARRICSDRNFTADKNQSLFSAARVSDKNEIDNNTLPIFLMLLANGARPAAKDHLGRIFLDLISAPSRKFLEPYAAIVNANKTLNDADARNQALPNFKEYLNNLFDQYNLILKSDEEILLAIFRLLIKNPLLAINKFVFFRKNDFETAAECVMRMQIRLELKNNILTLLACFGANVENISGFKPTFVLPSRAPHTIERNNPLSLVPGVSAKPPLAADAILPNTATTIPVNKPADELSGSNPAPGKAMYVEYRLTDKNKVPIKCLPKKIPIKNYDASNIVFANNMNFRYHLNDSLRKPFTKNFNHELAYLLWTVDDFKPSTIFFALSEIDIHNIKNLIASGNKLSLHRTLDKSFSNAPIVIQLPGCLKLINDPILWPLISPYLKNRDVYLDVPVTEEMYDAINPETLKILTSCNNVSIHLEVSDSLSQKLAVQFINKLPPNMNISIDNYFDFYVKYYREYQVNRLSISSEGFITPDSGSGKDFQNHIQACFKYLCDPKCSFNQLNLSIEANGRKQSIYSRQSIYMDALHANSRVLFSKSSLLLNFQFMLKFSQQAFSEIQKILSVIAHDTTHRYAAIDISDVELVSGEVETSLLPLLQALNKASLRPTFIFSFDHIRKCYDPDSVEILTQLITSNVIQVVNYQSSDNFNLHPSLFALRKYFTEAKPSAEELGMQFEARIANLKTPTTASVPLTHVAQQPGTLFHIPNPIAQVAAESGSLTPQSFLVKHLAK